MNRKARTNKNKNTGIATALTLALTAAAPQAAQAAAYALSASDISSFGITFAPVSGYSFSGFTFTGDTAALGGSSSASGHGTDAAAACVGAFCATFNNEFFGHGSASPGYAYGDTKIFDLAVLSGTGHAASIGEAATDSDLANASGTNSMIASIFFSTAHFVSFSFIGATDLAVDVTASGVAALASSTFSVTLQNSLGAQVFSWTPNGSVGDGIVGGIETADAYNLNRSLGLFSTGSSFLPEGPGLFAAGTAPLAAGFYTLNISMGNSVFVQGPDPVVPVPAAAWLFGAGLAGLASVARRRKPR